MKQNNRAGGYSGNLRGPFRILGRKTIFLTDFSSFFSPACRDSTLEAKASSFEVLSSSAFYYPNIQLNSFSFRPPYPHYLLEVWLCEGLSRSEWGGEEKCLP